MTPIVDPPANPERDLARALASIGERRLRLDLTTLDVGFLALLHLRSGESQSTAFGEEQLFDAFEYACNALEPNAENVRTRATHTLRRLREQQLLTRVDSAGVVRAGEYALSRLALGILEFYLEDDVLTRESLSLLTSTLIATLAQVLDATKTLLDPSSNPDVSKQTWTNQVNGPLTVTCRELLAAIEKRQRGMDRRQEQFQREVSSLLAADWFGSLDQCQSLLDTSAAALRELNDVLLRDTQHLQALLTEVSLLADEYAEPATATATAQVIEQVDRIANWGSARQKAWSDYYEYVHRYLRDVVRLDPTRALSQRLRQQLLEHGQGAFSLTVAATPSLRMLREPVVIAPPPPVRRPRKTREQDPIDQKPDDDPMLALELSVRDTLASGITDLSEITLRLTADLAPSERFVTAGRIAEVVGRMRQRTNPFERPWVDVTEDLCIEQRRLTETGRKDDHE